MTFCKPLYLLEALIPTDVETVCYSHVNPVVTKPRNVL